MTSHARIFFAGVGTTFVILAIGFGGGVLLATSAVQDNGSAVKRPPSFPRRLFRQPASFILHPGRWRRLPLMFQSRSCRQFRRQINQ